MPNTLSSHSAFTLPRIPVGRIVSLRGSTSQYPANHFKGFFETSGVENIGDKEEVYILRRIKTFGESADFLKIPRHWQEEGALIVHDMRADSRYCPASTAP